MNMEFIIVGIPNSVLSNGLDCRGAQRAYNLGGKNSTFCVSQLSLRLVVLPAVNDLPDLDVRDAYRV